MQLGIQEIQNLMAVTFVTIRFTSSNVIRTETGYCKRFRTETVYCKRFAVGEYIQEDMFKPLIFYCCLNCFHDFKIRIVWHETIS